MERIVVGTSARYLYDVVDKIIKITTTRTDQTVMKKARLRPESMPDVMYCHLLQVQITVSDLGVLILKAATLYTTRVRDSWNQVDVIGKLVEVLNSQQTLQHNIFRAY